MQQDIYMGIARAQGFAYSSPLSSPGTESCEKGKGEVMVEELPHAKLLLLRIGELSVDSAVSSSRSSLSGNSSSKVYDLTRLVSEVKCTLSQENSPPGHRNDCGPCCAVYEIDVGWIGGQAPKVGPTEHALLRAEAGVRRRTAALLEHVPDLR